MKTQAFSTFAEKEIYIHVKYNVIILPENISIIIYELAQGSFLKYLW